MIKEIYLAGGCFWGVEEYISNVPGVMETETGYANGKTENPTYEQVCRENTGHAETVRVVYDDGMIPLYDLLAVFLEAVDPVSVNRQGPDIGSQYRTGIYYMDSDDRPIIMNALKDLQAKNSHEIAIKMEPLLNYTKGEEHHQKYLDKNPGGYCHISPQLMERAKIPKRQWQPKKKEELKKELSGIQYHVTQESGTEPPFQNEYWNEYNKGIYVDITTGEPLFASSDKFESGCGWPSFSKPIRPAAITEHEDGSHFMTRTEVRSKSGNAHLGHVFDDGPSETGGLRYCINSAALRFIPEEKMVTAGYGEFTRFVE